MLQQVVRIATVGGRNFRLTENNDHFPKQYYTEFLIIN